MTEILKIHESQKKTFLNKRVFDTSRRKKGLVLKEIAKQIGIPYSTMNSWRAGNRNVPTDKIVQLAEILGTTYNGLTMRPKQVQIRKGVPIDISAVTIKGSKRAVTRLNHDYLDRVLKIRGYTQQELGEQIGATKDQISDWKCGRANIPVLKAQQIAEVLGVKYDDLTAQTLKIMENALVNMFLDSLIDYQIARTPENFARLGAAMKLALPFHIPNVAQRIQLALSRPNDDTNRAEILEGIEEMKALRRSGVEDLPLPGEDSTDDGEETYSEG